MNILVLDKFYKSVPKDKEEKVRAKVLSLVQQLRATKYDFERLPKGSSFRKVEEVDRPIYKFKFNEGDRILCTIAGKFYPDIREEYRNSLVLLEYCTHDKQIVTARNRDFGKQGVRRLDPGADVNTAEATASKLMLQDSSGQGLTELDLNLNLSTPVIIGQDQLDQLFGEESYLYYLDPVQHECAAYQGKAQLVLGSAGSGKTTIGAYKLATYIRDHQGENLRLAYVTFSRRLKEKVEQLFYDIATKLYGMKRQDLKGKVDFFTFEEHLETAAVKGRQAKLITFSKFKEWYSTHSHSHSKPQPGTKGHPKSDLNRQELDPLALWKERRGILQGLIGVNWQYELPISSDTFQIETLHLLHERGYIHYSGEEGVFTLKQQLHEIETFLQYGYGGGETFKNGVLQAFDQHISSTTELSQEEYLNLNETYTMFSREQRERALRILKAYSLFVQHQSSQGYVEEGDWVRLALAQCTPVYDYMVIDEVQDLTEVQVYYLSRLLKKASHLYVCGDFHQNVNPTFFNAGRLESILGFVSGSSLVDSTRTLTSNYRSSSSVVEFANAISELRNSTIRTKQALEWIETAKREYTRRPFLYRGREELLLQHVADKSYVMVLVPHEGIKQELLAGHKELESRVLTVSEMKGIERRYIVSYNMMSAFQEEWQTIFNRNSGGKLNQELYRYYFNLLYVAVTRARDVFCMVEDRLGEETLQWLETKLDLVDRFDPELLGLSESSTLDDLWREALDYEREEMYEPAIAAYDQLLQKGQSAYSQLAQRGQQRCGIKLAYSSHRDAARCGRELVELQEYEEAIVYLRRGQVPQLLLQAILLSENSESYDLPGELDRLGTNPLRELMKQDSEALTSRYLDRETKSYQNRLKSLEKASGALTRIFTKPH